MVTEKRLIDANEVLQRNEEAFEKANKKPAENFVSVIQYHTVKEMVNSSPTLDAVEVVHGRWEKHGKHDWRCSVCKAGVPYSYTGHKYCHNCGAKMDKGSENIG